jgi:hypothetical protein
MSNKNRVTFIRKSASLDSLHVVSTTDNSFVTSTTTQPVTSKIPVNIRGMKATILTPKRPPVVSESSAMSDEQVSSIIGKTDDQPISQNNRDDLLRISLLVDK